jgi:polar amino acid transport system substrate-binding protein
VRALRASINLGNPVLAHGTPDQPAGVTVDLASELAGRLGVPVSLSRTLTDAGVVARAEGIDVFLEQDLEVAAGIRQPLTRAVARHGGLRILEPRFMEIRQASRRSSGRAAPRRCLREAIEELKANGFVAAALERSGQEATVAPPG